MSDVDAKRAANIARKEAERKDRNAAIAAKKRAAAGARADERTAKQRAEDERRAKAAELEQKRERRIADKEADRKVRATEREKENKARADMPSSKYSRKEVLMLKAVFDEYDRDGSGELSMKEFRDALKRKKETSGPRPGGSTRAQRQAAEGISIADLSEATFRQLDADESGNVTFKELLNMMFPLANAGETETMLAWVKKAEPEPEPQAQLSAEAKEQIRAIFKVYDTDRSGALTIRELTAALTESCVSKEEVGAMFGEYDADGNQEISLEEFTELMQSTGIFEME